MIKRRALIAKALRLEWITVAWMVIEAAVAIGSGIMAHSLTLIAFGADSIIEVASACALTRRLSIEIGRGEEVGAKSERRAARIGSVLLFALSGYVIVAAGWSLWTRTGQEFSIIGLVLAVVVAGLIAQGLIGAWWIDGVSALALIPFLLREALEAWEDDAG